MSRLPTLIVSSVVRGSQLGESHGGVYLVDLDRGAVAQKLDWNRTDIDIAGRGGDRGLRGIAFHREHILIASNSALLMLDQDFVVVDSYTNPYLRHCHEISVADGRVFLTSTGYDSLLCFDLATRRFAAGWQLCEHGGSLSLRAFHPLSGGGPTPGHRFHLNSIQASSTGFYFSGLHTTALLCLDGGSLTAVAALPQGTHNAQRLGAGVLYNDTVGGCVCHRRDARATQCLQMPVPAFAAHDIQNLERFTSVVARPHFARGLCTLGAALIAGGSSPSTIAVHDLRDGTRVLQLNLSMDVRNAVHGLAVWPYS